MCWICRRTGAEVSYPCHSFQGAKERTRQAEEDKPVYHQNRPEHGDVKDLRPAAQEPDGDGSGRRVPELELRESADKGAELVVVLGGETGAVF